MALLLRIPSPQNRVVQIPGYTSSDCHESNIPEGTLYLSTMSSLERPHIRTDATADRQSFPPRRFSHRTLLKTDRQVPRLPALIFLPSPLAILSSQLITARMIHFLILNGLRGALIHRAAIGAGLIGASISWLKNFCRRSRSTIAPLVNASVGYAIARWSHKERYKDSIQST